MIQEKIIEMLAEKVDCDPAEISEETAFADLGIDSLDVAELVMNLEDEFDIEMEMDQSLTTVGAVVARIEEIKG